MAIKREPRAKSRRNTRCRQPTNHRSKAEVQFSVESRPWSESDLSQSGWTRQPWPTALSPPQSPPFKGVEYLVSPEEHWHAMQGYKKFVLKNIKFGRGSFVYVAQTKTFQKSRKFVIDNDVYRHAWVALILEVRAKDEEHVYALVLWMYRPSELRDITVNGVKVADGPQPYHGIHEIIASNHVAIIEACSVMGEADVQHWKESSDDKMEVLFWRQTLDCITSYLTPAQPFCRCGTPAHPDKLLIQCKNEKCQQWMHQECLQHNVLIRNLPLILDGKPNTKTEMAQHDAFIPFVSERNQPYQGLLEARLEFPNDVPLWHISDTEEMDWYSSLYCLVCQHLIE